MNGPAAAVLELATFCFQPAPAATVSTYNRHRFATDQRGHLETLRLQPRSVPAAGIFAARIFNARVFVRDEIWAK
jgi:hypothetical protein